MTTWAEMQPEQGIIQEQSPPTPSKGDVWLLVLKDMEDRRQLGIRKYGGPLQPNNGRDGLIDAYQEALDLCVYLRQAIEERNQVEQLLPKQESSNVKKYRCGCLASGPNIAPNCPVHDTPS